MNTTQDDKDICPACSGTRDDPDGLGDTCPTCKGVGSLVPLETILADGVANVRELLCDAINGGDGDYEEITYRQVYAWIGDLPKVPALLKALEALIDTVKASGALTKVGAKGLDLGIACLDAKAALAQVGGGK